MLLYWRATVPRNVSAPAAVGQNCHLPYIRLTLNAVILSQKGAKYLQSIIGLEGFTARWRRDALDGQSTAPKGSQNDADCGSGGNQ